MNGEIEEERKKKTKKTGFFFFRLRYHTIEGNMLMREQAERCMWKLTRIGGEDWYLQSLCFLSWPIVA